MKNVKRLMTLLLLLVTLVSVLAFPVSANNIDVDIQAFEAPIGGGSNNFRRIPGRKKDDDSPAYLFITKISNQYVRVRAYGQTGTSSSDCNCYVPPASDATQRCSHKQNCTYWGTWVPFVRCRKMSKANGDLGHAVSSLVKENNWGYISLGFQSANTNATDRVTGWWSADSNIKANYEPPIGP